MNAAEQRPMGPMSRRARAGWSVGPAQPPREPSMSMHPVDCRVAWTTCATSPAAPSPVSTLTSCWTPARCAMVRPLCHAAHHERIWPLLALLPVASSAPLERCVLLILGSVSTPLDTWPYNLLAHCALPCSAARSPERRHHQQRRRQRRPDQPAPQDQHRHFQLPRRLRALPHQRRGPEGGRSQPGAASLEQPLAEMHHCNGGMPTAVHYQPT